MIILDLSDTGFDLFVAQEVEYEDLSEKIVYSCTTLMLTSDFRYDICYSGSIFSVGFINVSPNDPSILKI